MLSIPAQVCRGWLLTRNSTNFKYFGLMNKPVWASSNRNRFPASNSITNFLLLSAPRFQLCAAEFLSTPTALSRALCLTAVQTHCFIILSLCIQPITLILPLPKMSEEISQCDATQKCATNPPHHLVSPFPAYHSPHPRPSLSPNRYRRETIKQIVNAQKGISTCHREQDRRNQTLVIK